MRFLGTFVLFSLLALAASPRLTQVQSIYILPMGSGMDQFLANRLTRYGKIQVVADPQGADAILTDRIGEPFEKKMDDLYVEKDEDESSDNKADEPVRSGFSRGKGTFFIVDRKTRSVLWSVYERPKNSSADELNRVAERVVNHLKRDLNPPASSNSH